MCSTCSGSLQDSLNRASIVQSRCICCVFSFWSDEIPFWLDCSWLIILTVISSFVLLLLISLMLLEASAFLDQLEIILLAKHGRLFVLNQFLSQIPFLPCYVSATFWLLYACSCKWLTNAMVIVIFGMSLNRGGKNLNWSFWNMHGLKLFAFKL